MTDPLPAIQAVLERVAVDGLPALAPCVDEETATLLRGTAAFAAVRSRLVVAADTFAVCGGEARFRVVRWYPGAAHFARVVVGGWGVSLVSESAARLGPDRVVGLPDGLDTVDSLAAFLGDTAAVKVVRVYLAETGGWLPLSVFAGFAAANPRLGRVSVVAVHPSECGGDHAGRIEFRGEDCPFAIRMNVVGLRVLRVNGRRPVDAFRRMLG